MNKICDCKKMICNNCNCIIPEGPGCEYEIFWYVARNGKRLHEHCCLVCQMGMIDEDKTNNNIKMTEETI